MQAKFLVQNSNVSDASKIESNREELGRNDRLSKNGIENEATI
jgi:hypothetical protein